MTDTEVKLEGLPQLVLAASTLLYGEKSPYTALADAGKIPLSLLDSRYNALYLALAGGIMSGAIDMGNQNILNAGHIAFDLAHVEAPSVGHLRWNNTEGTLEVGALGGSVVLQIGQESHVYCINKSGADIFDGNAVTLTGAQADRPTAQLSDANDPPLHDSAVGLATEDIPNNALGYVTTFGIVRGIKTDTWSEGDRLWATNVPGVMSVTPPDAPSRRIFIGTVLVDHPNDGTIFVSPVNVPNLSLLSDVYIPAPQDKDILRWVAANSRWEALSALPHVKSETITTQGLGASPDVFAFGAYQFSTTKVTLTQASLTQVFGDANVTYAMHSFIVAGGPGSVDTGVVGLRVTGTSITDGGVRTVGDSETLSTDITTLILNEYVEGKKWLGTITFELYVVSGVPTTYSLDFNYGIVKYDDWWNLNFTITDIEVTGLAGADDGNFDVKLLHHESSNWIYAVAGFTPASAGHIIASLVGDHVTDNKLKSGQHFYWKRDNLSQAVLGSVDEGFIILVCSSANNAVEYCNLHVGVTI